MSEGFDDGASPVTPAEAARQAYGFRTNVISGVAQWAADLTLVVCCERCGGSFKPSGQVTSGGAPMSLWPNAYALGLECVGCQRRVGIVFADPSRPDVELPPLGAFAPRGR